MTRTASLLPRRRRAFVGDDKDVGAGCSGERGPPLFDKPHIKASETAPEGINAAKLSRPTASCSRVMLSPAMSAAAKIDKGAKEADGNLFKPQTYMWEERSWLSAQGCIGVARKREGRKKAPDQLAGALMAAAWDALADACSACGKQGGMTGAVSSAKSCQTHNTCGKSGHSVSHSC